MSASSRPRRPVSRRGESIDHQDSRERQLEGRRAVAAAFSGENGHFDTSPPLIRLRETPATRRSTVSRTHVANFRNAEQYKGEIIAPTVCRTRCVQPLRLAQVCQPLGTRLVTAPHHDGTIPHVQCESHVHTHSHVRTVAAVPHCHHTVTTLSPHYDSTRKCEQWSVAT